MVSRMEKSKAGHREFVPGTTFFDIIFLLAHSIA